MIEEEITPDDSSAKPCEDCQEMIGRIGMISAIVGVVVGMAAAIVILKAS